jgi:hypothetical protein
MEDAMVHLIIVLVVLGLVAAIVWVIVNALPIDEWIKQLTRLVLLGLILILVLLKVVLPLLSMV